MEKLILECYDGISLASSRMLSAARSGDWDGLVEAEGDCAAMVNRLQTLDDQSPLSADGMRRKMLMIRKVLAEDAEIRGLTQPWLETLETLLCGQVSQRRVRDLYT